MAVANALYPTYSACREKRSLAVEKVGLRSRATEGNLYTSWSEGIGPFHGKAGLADLGRILCLPEIRSSPRIEGILPNEPQRSMSLRTPLESGEPNSL